MPSPQPPQSPASNEDPEVIACIFLRDEFSARTATATFANFLVAGRDERASNWKLRVVLASGLDIGVGGRCSPFPVYALVKFSSWSQRCVTEGVDQFSDGDVVPDGLRCLQAHA